MKKVYLFLMLFISIIALCSFGKKAYAKSYMSDKTEVPVSLEVSGAEALAQTDDGYVWIAQYSGLTRYDANNFVSYNSFFENGEAKDLINVRALASKENTLYIATSSNVIVHKDDSFHQLNIETGTVRDIILDKDRDMLYISTESKGAIIYDINNKTSNVAPGTEGKLISDIALNFATGGYFYQSNDGVYDDKGVCVLNYPKVLDIYSFGDILYMGQDDGIIHRYNMKTKQDMPYIVVSDQINKMLYSNEEKILFVACETNGIYCVDLSTDTPQISLAGDLENKSQLVDLMIDYEGNLWVASHYIGASGVSIITKNALLELLYDDPIWQDLPEAPKKDRNIYAVERFDDILYIVADARIYFPH